MILWAQNICVMLSYDGKLLKMINNIRLIHSQTSKLFIYRGVTDMEISVLGETLKERTYIKRIEHIVQQIVKKNTWLFCKLIRPWAADDKHNLQSTIEGSF